MDDFLKMDVFFVVATTAVVVFAALLTCALVLVIRILRNVERISETVTEEAQLLKGDLDDMRLKLRSEGFKWTHIPRFIREVARRLFRALTR
jgi:hypothetical protein